MRSPNRKHDRDIFYKYMSASTAVAVLESRRLRWSSPLLFNDPFDVPREFAAGVSPESIAEAAARALLRLIKSPPADTSRLKPKLRLIAEAVKRGMASDQRAKLIADIQDYSHSHQPSGSALDELRSLWRSWLDGFRILCLSESRNNIAMWYHYADCYRGAVLELRCLDAVDSAWLMAKPIDYTSDKPAVYSADGLAEILNLATRDACEMLMHVATYTKGRDWAYEREWRVASSKRPGEIGLFTDYRFDLQELSGVCLGPHMPPADRARIIALASGYPDATTANVTIGMSRELHFHSQ